VYNSDAEIPGFRGMEGHSRMSPATRTRLPKAKRQVVALSVKLEVITPDKLRKIVFGLTKGTDEGVITWTIEFELHDRTKVSDSFGKVIDLDVEVKTRNEPLAEETAAKGMNDAQVEHAITRAAPAAARLAEGTGSEAAAARAIEGVLTSRNA
jgi:hypothetical protein